MLHLNVIELWVLTIWGKNGNLRGWEIDLIKMGCLFELWTLSSELVLKEMLS